MSCEPPCYGSSACKVPTLVDGAHCPGLLHWAGENGSSGSSVGGIRLDSLGADFYLANFYKWMLTPRACACLYTDPDAPQRFSHIAVHQFNTLLASTAPISSVGMDTESVYAGLYDESTRDYAAFLALPSALALLRWMRPQELRQYCNELCVWGTAHLGRVWGTMPPIAPALSTAMITAELPLRIAVIRHHYRHAISANNHADDFGLPCPTHWQRGAQREPVQKVASVVPSVALSDQDLLSWAKSKVHAELLAIHQIEVPIFVHEGTLYVRASCWAYNERADLVALGDGILEIANRWQTGQDITRPSL